MYRKDGNRTVRASSYGLDLKKKQWLSVMKMTGVDMEKLPPLVLSTDIVGGLTEEATSQMGLLA